MSARDRFESCPALPVQVSELAALADGGTTALLVDPERPAAPARQARVAVDLHGGHIGRRVVVAFEGGDPSRPIVMGVLLGDGDRPNRLAVQADGERLVVSARRQLVLRCGKASITLTSAGKVLIEGEYLLSRSNGVNRIKGGSVQLN